MAGPVRAKLDAAMGHKEAGNERLKIGDTKQACFSYKLGLTYLKDFELGAPDEGGDNAGIMRFANRSVGEAKPTEAEQQEARDLYLSLALNLAQANLKREKWDDVIRFATDALRLDPDNPKALYRRGKAYFGKGDLDNAQGDWTRVHETDPAAVAKELKLLEKAFAAHKQKEKATFAKMFSPAD